MLAAYLMIFWIPLLASSVLLLMSLRGGDLTPRHTLILFGWWVVAGYLQLFGGSPATWAVGLVAHAALAIYLSVRWKLNMWDTG